MTNSSRVDTTGLERAQVLCALVNGTKAQGSGHLNPNARRAMTYDDAKRVLHDRTRVAGWLEEVRYYFDYVGGRPIKVDLSDEDGFDPDLYDRDAGGSGAAQRLIDRLRNRLRS